MTGLSSVKLEVTHLINFLTLQKKRRDQGLATPSRSLHMVFTGNPGTGKTTVARLIAQIYAGLGILSKGHLVETDRSGLVAAYLGQTALKVQDRVKEALGGVLFIDEAYSLTDQGRGTDQYGQEAVSTLLKLMEDHRGDLIVIVAGYTAPMKQFVNSNPGLQSRFSKCIEFQDYDAAELSRIFVTFCSKADYKLSQDALAKLENTFAAHCEQRGESFGNARLARNVFEMAIENQAGRLSSAIAPTLEMMTEIQESDIPSVK